MRGAVKRRRRSDRCRRPERPARSALQTRAVAAPPRPPRSPRLPRSRRAFRSCVPLPAVRPRPLSAAPKGRGLWDPSGRDPRGRQGLWDPSERDPGTTRDSGTPRGGTRVPRLHPARTEVPRPRQWPQRRRAGGNREPVAGAPGAESGAQRAVERERGRGRTGARTRRECSRLLRKGWRGRRALHPEPPGAGGFAQKENAVSGVKRKLNLQEADLPRSSESPAAGMASFPPRARVPSGASRRSSGGDFQGAGYTRGAVLRGVPRRPGPKPHSPLAS